jgi:hypothetical protein
MKRDPFVSFLTAAMVAGSIMIIAICMEWIP